VIRYLLDENIDPLYRSELLKRESEIEVRRVGLLGAPAHATPDPEILCWCEENDFFLVTNDRNTIPQHMRNHLAQVRHVPGIFMLSPGMSVGENIQVLVLIWAASEEYEYFDQIVFLPISY
jgi:predicted nuclease of predicted toxin-antitoxin system